MSQKKAESSFADHIKQKYYNKNYCNYSITKCLTATFLILKYLVMQSNYFIVGNKYNIAFTIIEMSNFLNVHK